MIYSFKYLTRGRPVLKISENATSEPLSPEFFT